MRTTLTLDADVAERLKQELAGGRRTLKEVINEGLRQGLQIRQTAPRKPFRVRPHASAYQPGVDRGKLTQLLDELDAREFTARTEASSP